MPTTLQFRRGTTAQNDAFTGAAGEITFDTTLNTIIAHDGTTAGGHTLVGDTSTQTLTNKTLTSPNITGLQLGGVAVTATAAELNILDGVTSTASELNILDGVTSTASELNILDGVTATTAELNYVDGVTSAIQTQLNAKVETLGDLSVTATAAELNKLDGVTATTAELNYVDGVTSAIQTQLNAKAPTASPALTGTPTAPTAAVNTNTTQVATTAYVVSQIADDAPTKTGTGASGTWGISISGTAALATSVTATANNTTNETVYLTFVDGATGTQGIETDTNLTYNPSTNVLSTTATSARYADLAERYLADSVYEAGHCVVFGGTLEITESTVSHDTRVAGVISTAPAYLMNEAEEDGQPVALTGRVPTKVKGPIAKGDLVVTSDIPGVAQKLDDAQYKPGCVIGKALNDIETDNVESIEVVVGRL